MSRLFKKNNSVSKIVALWLAFIMLTTPFFAHAGLKNDSKAESATPGTPTATIYISADEADWETDMALYYKSPYDATALSDKYYYGVSEVKIAIDTSKVVGPIVNHNGVECTLKECEVGFIVSPNPIEDPNTVRDSALITADEVVLNDDYGWYLYAYIKPNLQGTYGDNQIINYNGVYALYGSYHFVEDNPMADINGASPVKLVDPDNAATAWVPDNWYKSVGIKNETGSNLGYWAANTHKCAGLIRYGYAEKGSTDITWSTEFTTGGFDVEPVGLQGECDIYVGLFATEDDATNNVPITKRKIETAKIDNVAPVIEKQGLFYSEDWNSFNIDTATAIAADDNKVLYRDGDASKYRYYIKLADGGSPVTVSTEYNMAGLGQLTVSQESDNVWCVKDITAVNDTPSLVRFKLEDSFNETRGTLLPKIVPADTTKQDVTVSWFAGDKSGTYNNTNSWGYDRTLGKDEYISLRFEVESYNEVEKIYITEGSTTIDEWTNTTTGTPNPYYNVFLSENDANRLTIPADIADNGDYTDLKINVKFKNVADVYTLSMKDVLIDQTAPIFCANTTQPATTADIVDLADTYPADKWYKSSDYMYIYFYPGLSGVTESSVTAAYYTINDGQEINFDPDGGSQYISFYTVNAGDNTIKLYAVDQAGNEVTKELTVKIDKENPEIKETTATTPAKKENSAIAFEATDNNGIAGYKVEVRRNGTTVGTKEVTYDQASTTKEDTIYLKDIVNNLVDGQYYVDITVYDVAGNSDTEYSVYLYVDNNAPTFNYIKLQRSSDGSNWSDVPSDNVVDNVYYMHNNGSYEDTVYNYRYEVSLYDEGGVNDATTGANIDTSYFIFGDPFTDVNSNGYFHIYVDEQKVGNAGIPVVPSFEVVDLAGNEMSSPVTCDTKIAMVSTAPTGSVTLKDADGNEVNYKSALVQAQLAAGTNKGYKAEISLSSYKKIDGIALSYGTAEKIEGILDAGSYSEKTKLYTYQTTITIPTDSNKKFSDLKVVYLFEGDTTYTTYDSLATILYDKTAPVITTNPENATPVAITYPTGWVQSFAVDYKITSGDGNVESLLSEASCTVDTVVNKVEDAAELTGTISLTTSSTSVDGTKITIKAKDKAGNELPEEIHYVKVDADAPEVELEVDGETSYDITADAPLNEIPEVYYYAEDNLTFDVVTLKIEGPDSISKEIDLIAGIQDDEKVDINVVNTKTLDKFLDTVPDGEYTITLIAKDKAGNDDVATISFILDTEAPEVKNDNVVFERKAPEGAWETVPASEVKNGVYYMALDGGSDPYYDYRFKVTSTDDYKINEWAVKEGLKDLATCTFDYGTDAWDGNFYLNIDESKISTTSSKTISFNVWDWAGNYKSVTATPKLSGTSSDVVFNITVYEAGEAITLTADKLEAMKNGTDKTYQVYADVYSVYQITDVYLSDKGDAHKITDGVVDADKTVFDPVTKQYRHVVTFDIPSDSNALFEDLTVYVKDAKGTSSHKIATILYDDTDPLFLDTNGNEIIFPTIWVQDFVVAYKIISGEETTEALLKDASCTVGTTANSVQNAAQLTGTISITESSSTIEGTKVTIKAEDKAGNTFSDTHYVKVDADEPAIDFTVAGEESYDITKDAPLKDIPEVKYDVTDNLTFDVVTLKIEGPNSVSKEIDLIADLESDEKVDINVTAEKTLDKFLGSTPDGTYTLTVTAMDKAGNDATATISFILDTEAPAVEEGTVVFERKTPNGEWTVVPETEIENGIYYMALDEGSDPFYDYRFKVTSTDTYKIDEEAVKEGLKGLAACIFDGGEDAWDGNFYLNIDETKISHTFVQDITFNLYDWAGNYTYVDAVPKLSGTSSAVVFDSIVYEAGKAIELTPAKLETIKNGTNDTYKVYVDVYSVYEFEEVYLSDKDDVHKITDGVVDADKTVFNPITKQYRHVVTFDIPSEYNAYFDELTVYAKDAKQLSSVKLLTILYDKTNPLVLDVDGNDLSLPTVWVEKIDVDYQITSGDGDVESKLAEAVYTVSGVGESLITTPVASCKGTVLIDESSATVEGTNIAISATDVAGNPVLKEFVVKVDADSPTVDTFTVADSKQFAKPIKGDPVIDATISDNLTFKTAVITVVGPTGTFTKSIVAADGLEEVDVQVIDSYALSEILGDTPEDGDYEISIDIEDKAGNSDTDTITFRLDNTDPVVTAEIASGAVSTKSDYYYRSDVDVKLTVTDINLEEVKVTDNDKEVTVDWSEADANGKSVATISLPDEGAHQIKITARDQAGTDAIPKEVSFYIDETDPVVSVVLNGGVVYDESMGVLDITRDVTLDVSVSDTNEDKKDLNYQLIQTKPDEATTTAQYIKTDVRSFTYTEEAEYTINLFSIDKADNQGDTRTVKFRIDNTAPALSISGVSAGGSSVNATTVTFTMQEAFWWDAHGTVNIYRQAGDGMAETLVKTIEITPTAKSTSVSETLADTGVYRFEFTASDRAGHTTETSQQFMVDRSAPLVTLTGASNYEITDKIVEIYSEITDDFYSTKKVEVVGTRTDIDGKVHTIEFSYNQSANPTVISKDLTEDGIYDISITATDTAGNSESKSLHFTIDKSEPVIGDLSKYDGTILTEFNWDEDLDELIADLTVCDVHMYLNGSEYDGTSKVEDGAYTLLIVAEDEMGNKVEKSVEFVLDTKAPVILVTGVEEDEVRMEDYNITVSLQLEEDTLTSVLLNGKPMTIGNNVCTFTVSEKGDYKLEVFAVDAAGNDVSYEMEFKYGEESVWWIWLLIALAVLLVIFFIIIILKKKGEKEEKK